METENRQDNFSIQLFHQQNSQTKIIILVWAVRLTRTDRSDEKYLYVFDGFLSFRIINNNQNNENSHWFCFFDSLCYLCSTFWKYATTIANYNQQFFAFTSFQSENDVQKIVMYD